MKGIEASNNEPGQIPIREGMESEPGFDKPSAYFMAASKGAIPIRSIVLPRRSRFSAFS